MDKLILALKGRTLGLFGQSRRAIRKEVREARLSTEDWTLDTTVRIRIMSNRELMLVKRGE